MCNQYGYNSPLHRLREVFGELKLPFRWPEDAPNLAPLELIRPTDPAPVVRAFEDGVRLDQLRWGFPPPRPKAGPVINFRSENRRFTHGRCLVPATHFFEFTGAKYPKTKWRCTVAGAEFFCFAGLVRDDRFTLLTCDPGPEIAALHDRQVVIIPRASWAHWLGPSDDVGGLLRPLPEGQIEVERTN
ncbi:MAG TPA: SOS response-associated peptidase family protein [Caulobacteraceae bacterium]|jgi:putative SOS response-associated peptidase YedK|nr:SOS response-associated peptidase family protein [Caulobacteraceae bacterium]